MKEIPNRLQCAYCIRNRTHGGECNAKEYTTDEKGCLVFRLDPRGCIRNHEGKLPFPLYSDIPLLNIWQIGWQYNGISTEIRITYIKGLSWDTKSGNLYVHCKYDYFVNEYHDDYVEPREKTYLRLVK